MKPKRWGYVKLRGIGRDLSSVPSENRTVAFTAELVEQGKEPRLAFFRAPTPKNGHTLTAEQIRRYRLLTRNEVPRDVFVQLLERWDLVVVEDILGYYHVTGEGRKKWNKIVKPVDHAVTTGDPGDSEDGDGYAI